MNRTGKLDCLQFGNYENLKINYNEKIFESFPKKNKERKNFIQIHICHKVPAVKPYFRND